MMEKGKMRIIDLENINIELHNIRNTLKVETYYFLIDLIDKELIKADRRKEKEAIQNEIWEGHLLYYNSL